MMKRILLMVFVACFALGAIGCQSREGVTRVEDAYMALDEYGYNPTKEYSSDATFYCMVTVLDTPEAGVPLKAIWYAVDVDGMDRNAVIGEIETTAGQEVIPFILSNENLWPVGKYKVEMYLNGELDTTIRFKVK